MKQYCLETVVRDIIISICLLHFLHERRVEVFTGGRPERETVYPNIHHQDALIDRVNHADSSRSLSEEHIRMNDHESIHSTPVEQGCEKSPSSASFLLNHFSFARDNHVTQPSVKLTVNTSDCSRHNENKRRSK